MVGVPAWVPAVAGEERVMGETNIEWARYTFNPWRGCTKVSPGCDHCYAETMSHRNPKVLGVWGDDGVRAIGAEAYWKNPLKWAAEARALGKRERVFCGSLMDVGEDRPELVAPRARLCGLVDQTADALVWMLLTKRIENILRLFPVDILQLVGLGVTTEDQPRADVRIPQLLRTPAEWRFISAEPLLGNIDLERGGFALHRPITSPTGTHWPGLDLVIAGGETDSDRPMHPDWARALRDQCVADGVAFFFKQHGDWAPGSQFQHYDKLRVVLRDGRSMTMDEFRATFSQTPGDLSPTLVANVGKHAAGRLLDGREWNEFPAGQA